ncbi:hypothetical protein MVEN_02436000 [Mycena venus]|uniref:Pheromone receptor n=1 Tax=Mycena venus TaxID=2733690 RepID=A0A8H6WYT4_9AGAR|nr:hypothetical protein MVEN_02436000 [Mycena venus]
MLNIVLPSLVVYILLSYPRTCVCEAELLRLLCLLSRTHSCLLRSLTRMPLHLIHFGRDIMQNAVGLIVESILLSAYGIFFAVAVYSIVRKGLKSRGSIIMLVVVIYLYAASVVLWALNLTVTFQNIRAFLMIPDVPLEDRGELADEVIGFEIFSAQEALFVFNMVIGDGVVIWRTWAVYQRRIVAIVIPSTLLLTSFVFGIVDITCSAFDGPLPGGDLLCPQGSLVSWALSVGTNVTCTILIGFKAWQHHKMMRELGLPGKTHKMSSEKILSLLVESGFIYTLLWVTQLVSYMDTDRSSPWWWVFEVTMPMGDQIAGMYPTLIIVIVNFHRTIWEESPSRISNLNGGATSNTLQWECQTGPTDMFGTQGGVNIHLETVTEITHANYTTNRRSKQSSSEYV